MACDKGFGQMETKFKECPKLRDPEDFFEVASKLKNADVKKLCTEDMLDLKKLAKDHFKHNKAKKCLFSRCKRVYLSKRYPLEMVLDYYDKGQACFDTESVFLADEKSIISKLKTTHEFQTYYLSHSGKSDTEVQHLLPRLQETKFEAILPKKFQAGQVMVINKEKLKDLASLKCYTHARATTWIEGIIARQNESNLRAKTKQKKSDDKIYFHVENIEDEMDLDIDTQGATVMNEDYHQVHTECEEEIVPKNKKKTHKKKVLKETKQMTQVT